MELDIEGGYILLQGHLDGGRVTILNSYGPNIDKRFYPAIQDIVAPVVDCPLMWMGDFNCADNGHLDRHPRVRTPSLECHNY